MSEQPKFTPGPWLFNGAEVHGGFIIERSDGSGFFLNATLSEARLTSAAPDLYAALERAENYIANTESELGLTLPCGDAARAALAKAKGVS